MDQFMTKMTSNQVEQVNEGKDFPGFKTNKSLNEGF